MGMPYPADLIVPPKHRFHIEPRRLARAMLVLGIASGLAVSVDGILAEGYISLIFLMAIMLNGAMHGLGVAVVSAVVGSVSFDLLITEPKWVITYSRPNDLAAPLVFILCALGSGMLSGRLKDEARRVHQRNLQLEALLEASRGMQRARNPAEVATALTASVIAQTGIMATLHDASGRGLDGGAPFPELAPLAQEALVSGVEWIAREGRSAFPLHGGGDMLGVLIAQRPDGTPLELGFMLALARMTSLALERTDLASRLAEAHAIARAEELKSALLSSVSHDLRSPLTAINTAAASLLSYGDQFDHETSQELLTGIVEESDRLNHLTTNLLQMSRLQGGPAGLSRSVLPALEMIRNATERQRKLGTGHVFHLHAPDGEVAVLADATLFDLVLANVLQNACLYSPPGTRVEITCQAEETMCRIAVSDEGLGIPPAEQEHVFERFYRVRREHGAPRGTGLGLAIARGFVEASGGAIDLASPLRDGRGTCIIIRLPLVPSEPRPDTV
jgi:two-component system, OmpR family, sensor histidine kinase KdpD